MVEKVTQWGYVLKAQRVNKQGPSKGPKRENAHKEQEKGYIDPPQDMGNVGESITMGWPSSRNKGPIWQSGKN